jgi:chromosome segregation ATPase
MRKANVKSIDVLAEFRATLLVFQNRVLDSLSTMQEEVFRALDYVENDRPRHWRQQVLDAFDAIAATRVAFEQAKMRKETAGIRASMIEEKTAIRDAKEHLQKCQQKVEVVRQAGITLHHEADEFRGRMSQLQQLVETDIPKMCGLLTRMLDALEKYAEIEAGKVDSSGVTHDPRAESDKPA